MLSRRDLLKAAAGVVAGARPLASAAAAAKASFGLVYTSFVVRLARGRDILKTTAARLDADAFFGLCERFAADGGQVDVSQIAATDGEALARLRRRIGERGLFAELSIPARSLESEAAFDRVASIAHALGITRLRVALLSGRRYETFATRAEWDGFASHWRSVLPRIRPAIERSGLQLGIENHKDWTTAELAELLRRIDSGSIGACVDFGNNVAFLEDPLTLAETLAPWAVTTHLKDMAVRPCEGGFELSEVPLGSGLLPLAEMIATLRRSKPDLHFCLEMITRDPLRVPYREDRYWATFGERDEKKVAAFERTMLSRAAETLPRITGLSYEAQIAAEDDNVRRSAIYARTVLGC
ncbi:MAG TPA: TIM barrel protein [Vicinamibacterales bacterium]|nr:TIM barrel protein [Vicinamibacterales bacterium]